MGVRILHDKEQNYAALYCSTTDFAFGPLFTDGDEHDADERAEAFLRWLKTTPTTLERDPRGLTDSELETAYSAWLRQEADQWTAEAAAEEAKYREEMQ